MAAFDTLLFVAPVTEAEAIALDPNEDAMDRWPSAWLKSIGDLELVELWDVLSEDENEGTLMADLAWSSPDGDVMVMTTPDEFVTAMAELGESDFSRVAAQWHGGELMCHWSKEDIVTILTQLAVLCRKAVTTATPVLQVGSI